MSPADRLSLYQTLLTFDEVGLVALSNKGLVRRAQKDLESWGTLLVEETEVGLLVRGPDWQVQMPTAGPTQATDDTKATGITRQILAATMWLRDHWRPDSAEAVAVQIGTENPAEGTCHPSPPPPTPAVDFAPTYQILTGIAVTDLEAWAGKTLVKEAAAILKSPLTWEVEERGLLRIRFPQHEVEVRLAATGDWLGPKVKNRPERLLNAVLSTAPKAFHSRWVLISILAWRQSIGLPLEQLQAEFAQEVEGTPLSRSELLNGIRQFLESMVITGLAHPSDLMVQRLFTLSVSCISAGIPRLARLLKALAEELQLAIDRHAQADADRLFSRTAEAFALSSALIGAGENLPLSLTGRHRTEYEPLGQVSVLGCGAYSWQTQTGFAGLSVLFWDRQRQRFWTWSYSRPTETPGLNLPAVYRAESVWAGAGAPENLSRSEVQLEHALANHLGRLSGSKDTLTQSAALVSATQSPYTPETFGPRGFTEWAELSQYAVTTVAMGLREQDPSSRLVAVFPAQWGPRVFVEIDQRLSWAVLDAHGAALELSVPWTTATEEMIECLEMLKVDRDKLTGIVGSVEVLRGGLRLFPIAILSTGTPRGDVLINPAFDWERLQTRQEGYLQLLKEKYGRNQIASTVSLEESEEESPALAQLPLTLEKQLSGVEAYLQRLAEMGTSDLPELSRQRAQELAKHAQRFGLGQVTPYLEHLSHNRDPQRSILLAKYVCRLYRQAVG